MKIIIMFIILCQTVLFTTAQADIRLYPARLFFYQQEGVVQQKSVHLINKSAKMVVCKAELLDWKRDTLGNKIYYPAGTLATSASNILSLMQNTITLMPGEDKEISIEMNSKSAANEFKNSMLFFTQIDMDSLKSGLKVLIQLGVHVYSLPQKYTDKQIKINNAVWLNKDDDSRLSMDISNATTAIIDTDMRAEIFNEDGDKLEQSSKISISSMPNDAYKVTIPFIKTNRLKHASKIIVYIDNGFEYPLQVVEIPFKA